MPRFVPPLDDFNDGCAARVRLPREREPERDGPSEAEAHYPWAKVVEQSLKTIAVVKIGTRQLVCFLGLGPLSVRSSVLVRYFKFKSNRRRGRPAVGFTKDCNSEDSAGTRGREHRSRIQHPRRSWRCDMASGK